MLGLTQLQSITGPQSTELNSQRESPHSDLVVRCRVLLLSSVLFDLRLKESGRCWNTSGDHSGWNSTWDFKLLVSMQNFWFEVSLQTSDCASPCQSIEFQSKVTVILYCLLQSAVDALVQTELEFSRSSFVLFCFLDSVALSEVNLLFHRDVFSKTQNAGELGSAKVLEFSRSKPRLTKLCREGRLKLYLDFCKYGRSS